MKKRLRQIVHGTMVSLITILLFLSSCMEISSKNKSTQSDGLKQHFQTNQIPISHHQVECDVSMLRTRREYSSDKREETVYLLWNVYRIQLLQLEERASKLGSTIVQRINSDQKDSVIKDIETYVHDLNENKNALLQKPKLEELQKLSELMYCNYLRSIDIFSKLKEIVSMNSPKSTIVKNVLNFGKDPANDDFETMQKIGNEFKEIDKKYHFSQKKTYN